MRHRHLPALALLAFIVLSAACGDDAGGDTTQTTPSQTETNTSDEANITETDTSVVITITGLSFPAEVTVPAGKTVTWVNDSSAPHEVQMDTLDGAPADVEPVRLGTDQEGELSLEPGTWAYFCAIHPSMTGTLVVQG
ncbi:MAG: cupredoxin domain-containing protein [Acidimicrobiia bacterium]